MRAAGCTRSITAPAATQHDQRSFSDSHSYERSLYSYSTEQNYQSDAFYEAGQFCGRLVQSLLRGLRRHERVDLHPLLRPSEWRSGETATARESISPASAPTTTARRASRSVPLVGRYRVRPLL